jgi:hypothetical protein
MTKNNLPRGLVFSKGAPGRKKRTLILVAFLAILQLCLIWPVYPLFSSPVPQILGFPLSFAWVIFILICSFFALLVYFLKDTKEER